MSKIIYTGVFLNDSSKRTLLNYAESIITGKIVDNVSYYCDHMTCQFNKDFSQEEMSDFVQKYGGRDIELKATHVGMNDRVACVLVTTDVPSNNERKHITLATFFNGKPFDSNKINEYDFIQLEEPIILHGTVKAFEI